MWTKMTPKEIHNARTRLGIDVGFSTKVGSKTIFRDDCWLVQRLYAVGGGKVWTLKAFGGAESATRNSYRLAAWSMDRDLWATPAVRSKYDKDIYFVQNVLDKAR